MEKVLVDNSILDVDYILASLAAVERGEVVGHDTVKLWAASLKTDKPLPLPQASK